MLNFARAKSDWDKLKDKKWSEYAHAQAAYALQYVSFLIAEIEALRADPQRRLWTPCNEAIPQHAVRVRVLRKTGHVQMALYNIYIDGWYDKCERLWDVTHWMDESVLFEQEEE